MEIHAQQYGSGAEYNNGNSGTAKTVDWDRGRVQKVTMTGNCTFTLSNPKTAFTYLLRLVQDATGSRTATWPATVNWPGGTAPTLSGANNVDLISLYWDGTDYYGASALNYST